MRTVLCAPLVAVWAWVVPVRVPIRANVIAEIGRLAGQRVAPSPGARYRIEDIAGEGAPLVGRIARRGRALWLDTAAGRSFRLTGPLAIPRIAGPEYKVWVIGRVRGDAVEVRRLGVLAPPTRARGAGAAAAGATVRTEMHRVR